MQYIPPNFNNLNYTLENNDRYPLQNNNIYLSIRQNNEYLPKNNENN